MSPQTLAEKRLPDDVPVAEKTRRIVALQALQREIQLAINAGLVGRVEDVLVDSASRRRATELSGRTSANVVVNLPGDASWIGRVLPVAIERAGPARVVVRGAARGENERAPDPSRDPGLFRSEARAAPSLSPSRADGSGRELGL